jgi:hypothetical protein
MTGRAALNNLRIMGPLRYHGFAVFDVTSTHLFSVICFEIFVTLFCVFDSLVDAVVVEDSQVLKITCHCLNVAREIA